MIDSDEINVDKNMLEGLGEVYSYMIIYKVFDEMKEFYYSNYEM